ncbi:hypothetical protein J4N45_10265 [Vibrio sp. SCSIO 43140]|uniref:hypothetical protein n=1 Tax=Vibrio sp. SCSIO 43140 TaxID=2819100 RepID=UPI002075F1F7|nr:hypothetical protein [Vibrio sp. SCSIO 43140]USD58913.1 hypothetical protein J4N45_10265 [Vibrio sp. SCSIO 43140]
MSELDTQVQSFLSTQVYPSFNEQLFRELFSHLAPSNLQGDRVTLMCPKCGGNAEYYMGTGSIYCEDCKSIDLLDALTLFNEDSIKNNVREMATAASVQLPLNVYTKLLPEKPKLFEVIRDLTRVSVLSSKLERFGLTNDQLKACSNLVYIPDSKQLADVLQKVYGPLPRAVSKNLMKLCNCYAVLVMAQSRITFIELDGTSSEPVPFVRNYIKGSNTSPNVYLSNDPLFIELCWSMGLVAYLIDLKALTPKADSYLEKTLGSRNTVAVWGREVPSKTQLTFIKQSHHYDWFAKKVPSCYRRILEVCQ